MKFNVPYILNEMPSFRQAMDACDHDHTKAHYYLMIAKRVVQRTRIAESQNWRCCWCGTHMTEVPGYKNSVTREHIVPKSLGGSDIEDNIAAACNHCNEKRGVMPIDVFMAGFKSLKNPTIHA